MRRVVRFGGVQISYTLRRSSRRTLAITVRGDGSVLVAAPAGKESSTIDDRVQARAPWIMTQLRKIGDAPPPLGRRYVSGASHFLLGRELQLKVRKSREHVVRVAPPLLVVEGPSRAERSVARQLDQWRRAEARRIVFSRLSRLLPRVLDRRDRTPAVRIADMSRRWGSCSRRGTISINPLLVEKARGCVDYVLLHELCHLKHLNHGKEFENLLTEVLPDWRRWKRRLSKS